MVPNIYDIGRVSAPTGYAIYVGTAERKEDFLGIMYEQKKETTICSDCKEEMHYTTRKKITDVCEFCLLRRRREAYKTRQKKKSGTRFI